MAPLALSRFEELLPRELTRAPLLGPVEETRAAKEIEAIRERLAVESDPDRARALDAELDRAAGRLAMHNTRLAVSIARRYVHRGLPLNDLVQEALLGLLKAARRFEPRRGTRFSTAATWWIRQSVVLALQERGRLIRVPGRAQEEMKHARRVRAELAQTLGREPSAEEIAAESGLAPRKTSTLLRLLEAPLSLGAWEESLKAEGDVEAPAAEDLRKALASLDAREREILTRRYGLDDAEPETLDVIGARLGVTRERVRQLEKRALENARYALQEPSQAPAP
jgi:RNA polymerase sigma factor (sigma-70 family)